MLKYMTKQVALNKPTFFVVANKLKVVVIANKVLKQGSNNGLTQEHFHFALTQFLSFSFPKNLDFELTHDSRFKKPLKLQNQRFRSCTKPRMAKIHFPHIHLRSLNGFFTLFCAEQFEHRR